MSQNNYYCDYVYESGSNTPAVGVAVSVYIQGTNALATLYDAVGAEVTNPVTTGQDGSFSFYIITGNYDLYVLGEKSYSISLNGQNVVPEPLTVNQLRAIEVWASVVKLNGNAITVTAGDINTVTSKLTGVSVNKSSVTGSDWGLGINIKDLDLTLSGTTVVLNIYGAYIEGGGG